MPAVQIKDLPRRLQRIVLERAPWATRETPLQAAIVFHRQPEGAPYWRCAIHKAHFYKRFRPFIVTGIGLLLWVLLVALTEVITYAR